MLVDDSRFDFEEANRKTLDQRSWLSKLSLSWVSEAGVAARKSLLATSSLLYPCASHSAQGLRLEGPATITYSQLLWRLARINSARLVLSGLALAASYGCQLTVPIILTYLINSFSTEDSTHPKTLLWALAIFVLQVGNLLGTVTSNYLQNWMAFDAKTATFQLIFKNCLNLAPGHSTTYTNGAVTNMLGQDPDNVFLFFTMLHYYWGNVAQVTVALALLIKLMGPIPIVAGMAVAVASILLQSRIFGTMYSIKLASINVGADRISLLDQTLLRVRAVRMAGLEKESREKIARIRENQTHLLKKCTMISAVFWGSALGMPLIMTILAIVTYSCLGHPITAAVIFPALNLFNQILSPLTGIPALINYYAAAKASLSRVAALISTSKRSSDQAVPPPGCAVQVHPATCTWSTTAERFEKSSADFTLQLPAFDVSLSGLTVVVGHVGSGKSTLLSTLLGDTVLCSESADPVRRVVKIAYCPQDPQVFDTTMRENMTLGEEVDRKRYGEALDLCCLRTDILNGLREDCKVGENGNLLSGGQKARLALARAVYSQADLYLLDDPLSSLDASVRVRILQDVLLGELGDRARVIVTKDMDLVKAASQILFLSSGEVQVRPPWRDLNDQQRIEILDCVTQQEARQDVVHEALSKGDRGEQVDAEKELLAEDRPEEEREVGQVRLRVFSLYVHYGGMALGAVVVGAGIVAQTQTMASQYWLSRWSAASSHNDGHTLGFWLGIYSLFGGVQLISTGELPFRNLWSEAARLKIAFLHVCVLAIFTVLFAIFSCNVSTRIHQEAVSSLFRCPQAYFDTTPHGQHMNRLSRDIAVIDTDLPQSFQKLLVCLGAVLASLVLMIAVLPIMAAPIAVIIGLLILVQQRYRWIVREVRRLENVSRSPLYSHVHQTLDGLGTLRAYGQLARALTMFEERLDSANIPFYYSFSAECWLYARLGAFACLGTLAVGLFTALQPFKISISIGALLLNQTFSVTMALSGLVKALGSVERDATALERIRHYIHQLPAEQRSAEGVAAEQSNLFAHGKITFENVHFAHRPGLPAALQELSFQIGGGQKVAVVGRTGSGKSTILAALLRLADTAKGRIVVDGIDVTTCDLDQLRESISTVPQDGVLLTATLREVLDGGDDRGDDALWDMLDRVGLKELASKSLGSGLDSKVSSAPGSQVLSKGQIQLLCLARALLQPNSILLLDEATSSLGGTTEDRMFDLILDKKQNRRTVLAIIHSLQRIKEFDSVIVLDHGRVVELGDPKALMENAGSRLFGLVNRS